MGGRPSADYEGLGYRLVWALGSVFEHVRFLLKPENWAILCYSCRSVGGWPRIVLWRLGLKRPFKVKVAGSLCEVRKEEDYLFLVELLKLRARGFEASFTERGELRFQYKGRRIVLEFGPIPRHQALALIQKFAGTQKWFGLLDVHGRVVVDVGANIGDTPIYFYLNGASRVVALEPDPTFYALAARNVARNVPEADIVLLNQAAGRPGSLRVSLTPPQSIANPMGAAEGGLEVRVRGLDELVGEYSIRGGALKVVCVGCEVELFESSGDDSLKAFDQILVVAVYGSRWLTSRLKRCGFRPRVLERHYVRFTPNGRRLIVSVIYASKRPDA